MKKLLKLILPLVLIFCLSGCVFEEICLFYSDTYEKDGFFIAPNNVANCCFVGPYECTEYTENIEITIPDKYNNKPIKFLGGYIGKGSPCPFMISVGNLYMNTSADSFYDAVFSGDIDNYNIDADYQIKELRFILNIGKNIEKITCVDMDNYYPHINEDNSITFYHPTVYINCSEDNKHFYSKDGKLYDKKTDELISDFSYSKQ